MYSVRKIENGLLVSLNEANGNRKEVAFTDGDTNYIQDAKDFVTTNKTVIADSVEKQAHEQIDRITSEQEI